MSSSTNPVVPAAADSKDPKSDKKKDLGKLVDLLVEYTEVRDQVAKDPTRPDGVLLGKKGDLTREIDVLKRKYDLP